MSRTERSRSPQLEVPRKSVELEDAGARELDESSDDGQVFSDARDTVLPPLNIPITRVEKVDSSPSHGEVPGTPAYDKRVSDAVPDEIEVIPDGQRSRASSRAIPSPISPGHSPIPRTRVEKLDPASPSYGEVPGSPGWDKRRADAIPDAIENASPRSTSPSLPPQPPTPTTIPKTVITRVDSEPAHGEVPGTEAYNLRKQDAEPDIIEKKRDDQICYPKQSSRDRSYFRRVMPSHIGQSPIAEDGGFGPMDYESSKGTEDEVVEGGEFDDFEQDNGDDFGDFDDFEDGFQEAEVTEVRPAAESAQVIAIEPPKFPVLDFSSPASLEQLLEEIQPHLSVLFPAVDKMQGREVSEFPETNSAFLTDRSLQLWQQLVAPPPLQPPNWVRSRIRRLFLVSLGVPVDLDEILPKSKQKKLVLQYSPQAQKGGKDGASSKTEDSGVSNDSEIPANTKAGSKKRRGPLPPPDFNSAEVHIICTKTPAELESMEDDQLQAHVDRLVQLLDMGKDVLQYWVRRKEAAVGEKEAFDGVIENLVRHARRVRK